MNYKNPDTGLWETLYLPPTGDTLPVGTEVNYNGNVVPPGYEQIEEQIVNTQSDSTTQAYSCDYINNLHNYSETEQRVGTWIDGKPIYRKVINTTSPSTLNSDIIIAKATGADELIRLDGFISNKNIAIRLPLNYYYNDNNNAMCYFWTTNKNISMKVADTNYTSTEVTLIIEYTKTTD